MCVSLLFFAFKEFKPMQVNSIVQYKGESKPQLQPEMVGRVKGLGDKGKILFDFGMETALDAADVAPFEAVLSFVAAIKGLVLS